ncbi:MAG: hypothetical protein C4293_04285 [Nitrospiraceae bacterium]
MPSIFGTHLSKSVIADQEGKQAVHVPTERQDGAKAPADPREDLRFKVRELSNSSQDLQSRLRDQKQAIETFREELQ